MRKDPLIVIGMHRSGTSLLAEILRKTGVFMGVKRGIHEETLFFRRRNRYIYRLAHASWDNPKPMKYLIQNQDARLNLAASFEAEFASMKSLRDYWGVLEFWKSGARADYLWGWKDPRNSYSLPIWLELFPRAKIIHMYRNGIDVADSLRQRERNRKSNSRLLSYRCLELEGAFSLWVEYVNTCLKMIDVLPGNRAVQIQYEDFLIKPLNCLRDIASFLSIQLNESVLNKVIKEIQCSRAYAFLESAELISFYRKRSSHPLMRKLGYDRIPD